MGYYQEILKYAFQHTPDVVDPGITLVKTAMAFAGTGTSTISITGIQSGDLILFIGATDGGANTWADSFTTGVGILAMSGLVDGIAGYFFSTGTSFTITGDAEDFEEFGTYHYSVWRSVSPNTPMDTSALSVYGAAAAQPDPPSITTVTDGCVIVAGFMQDDVDSTGATPPTGYTLLNKLHGGTGEPTNYVLYKDQATAGAEDPAAFSGALTSDRHHDFTIALRPASKPEFTYIYWEATLGSPNTNFYVYCEFDVTNSDRPTSAVAYVTIDGSTPSSSNNETSATLSDTSAGSDGSTWDSSGVLGFNSSGVSISDVVKVLIVATNGKGTTDSVVVSLTVATIGNNNTEYTYP